jgi:hypothetical protein
VTTANPPVAEIRYQLDEHAPTAIAVQLRLQGIDALTAHESGLRGAADIDHVRIAMEHGRVLVTEDDDFLKLAMSGYDHSGIAYFPGGVRNISDVVNALALVHCVYSADEMIGLIEYL